LKGKGIDPKLVGRFEGCMFRALIYGRRKRMLARRRRADEEAGWLVSNNWLTIVTTPSPVFQKSLISKGL
jgi:hypothetical protein